VGYSGQMLVIHLLLGPVDYAREIVVQGSFFCKGCKTS
jgi:hypothetical protein